MPLDLRERLFPEAAKRFLMKSMSGWMTAALHFPMDYFPARIRRVIGKIQNPVGHFAELSPEGRECLDAWQDFCGGTLVAHYERFFS